MTVLSFDVILAPIPMCTLGTKHFTVSHVKTVVMGGGEEEQQTNTESVTCLYI